LMCAFLGLAVMSLLNPVSASNGYDFEARYTGEILSKVSGGIDTGTRYLDNLDLTLEVDVPEAWNIGAGMVIDVPITGSPDHQVGLAIASAGASSQYRQFLENSKLGSSAREPTYELTYRVPVNKVLALQPNIQWIQSPAAKGILDDAWVIGLRFELSRS